jgi:hypothetical protein
MLFTVVSRKLSRDVLIRAGAVNYIKRVQNGVGCDPLVLRRFIVADDNRYESEVRRQSPSSGVTNNQSECGVGKAIPIGVFDGVRCSCIVVKDWLFAKGMEGDERCNYAIWHEVAHARDFSNRDVDGSDISESDKNGHFKIRHMANIYTNMLIDEVVAHRFSAKACTQYLYKDNNQRLRDYLDKEVDRANDAKAYWRGDASEIINIKHGVCRFLWVVLQKVGELWASRYGNDNLCESVCEWIGPRADSQSVSTNYCELLECLFESYPVIPTDYHDRMFVLWKSLAASYGFTFSEQEGDDLIDW